MFIWNQSSPTGKVSRRSLKAKAAVVRAHRDVIETLEHRRMLSVTTSTLFGSQAAGVIHRYSVSQAGIVRTNITQTNIGSTTFNGHTSNEFDSVTDATADGNVSTTKSYTAFTSAGLETYGSVTTVTNASGGVISTDSVTDSPTQISFPATVVAGTPYTTTVTETNVLTPAGGTPVTSTDTLTETVTLTSEATQAVTVAAGTYNAYVFNTTETFLATDGTSTTSSGQEWLVTGVGPVKVTSGSGESASEEDLVSTTASGGGGGGGGGGASTGAVTPIVLKTTLPAAVVAGGKAHGIATVSLTNSKATGVKESVTTQIFASLTGTIDSGSVLVGTLSKTVAVRANSIVQVGVPIKTLPATLNGTYTLLAETTDAAGTSTATSGPSVTITAPFVAFTDEVLTTNLAGAVVSGSKTRDTATLTLKNSGNVVSTGSTGVTLLVSPDGTVANGTAIRIFSQSIVIQPGKTKTVKFALQTLPNVADGAYKVVAQLTDPTGHVTSASSITNVGLAQAFIKLTPTLSSITVAPNGSGTVLLTVVNNGNIAPAGASQIALYASATADISGATQLSTQRVGLPLQPSKTKTLRYHLTAAQLTSIRSAGSLVVSVTDPLGGVQTASTSLIG